jgi:Phage gp6-like head-tail connector protein
MPLATLDQLKLMLGITDTSQDALLTQILAGVDRAIYSFTKRDVLEEVTVTLIMSGNGRPDLVLPHRPVTSITSVHVDQDGYWGDGTNPFPAETLWTPGVHYSLIRDGYGVGPGGKSAILRRLGGALPGGGFLNWPPWPLPASPGLLAASRATYWPIGDGNIKVVMLAGYNPVPADLALAAQELAIQVYRRRAFGVPLQSESYAGYSYTLAISLLTTLIRQPTSAVTTLAHYRELSVA